MARLSPIADLIARAQAHLCSWGPPDGGVPIVATFGEVPVEYAAIRKSCGLVDEPHRALLAISGPDRLDFLNRMVTQELKGFEPYTMRRTFWLNRKGRIDADLRLTNLPDIVLAEVDTFAADRAAAGLSGYIITESCEVAALADSRHQFSLHGPGAAAVLSRFSTHLAGFAVEAMQAGQVAQVRVDGREATVFRDDTAGEIGLHLIMATADAPHIYQSLLQAAHEHAPGHAGPNPRPLLRPIGWHAFNIARIEAGTPLYNIDFGPDSLPAESGILDQRVSFKKGCYLGQEIVARMHALGAPKQSLVALRITDPAVGADSTDLARLPHAGSHITAELAGAEPIGAITSSTLAPMLSRTPIAFAMVRHKHAAPGAQLWVAAEGGTALPAVVQPGLAFIKR